MKIEPESPPEEYRQAFNQHILAENLNRIRLFSLVLFFLDLLLIVRDIVVTKAAGEWEKNIGNRDLLFYHVALLITSVTFFTFAKLGLRDTAKYHSRKQFKFRKNPMESRQQETLDSK